MESTKEKKSALYKNLQEKFQNLSFGPFAYVGKVGSGKSYNLKKYMKEVEEENKKVISGKADNGSKYTYVIPYNAWENNDCDKPILSLVDTILAYLNNQILLQKEEKEHAKRKTVLIETIKALSVLAATLSPLSPWLLPIGNAVFGFCSFFEKKRLKKKQSAVSSYTTIRDSLNQLAGKSNVIILVDEIDRCFPQFQLSLLESLHHISDDSSFIVLVSFVPDQITASLDHSYGKGNMSAEDYLNKVFNGRIETTQESPLSSFFAGEYDNFVFSKDSARGYYPNSTIHDIFTSFCESADTENWFSMREAKKIKEAIDYVKKSYGTNYSKLDYLDCLLLFFFACAWSKGNEEWDDLMNRLSGKNMKGINHTVLVNQIYGEYLKDIDSKHIQSSLGHLAGQVFINSMFFDNVLERLRNAPSSGLDENITQKEKKPKE